MKYTQIPATAFQNIQLNAGILVDAFTPSTGVIGNLLGATSGGVQFADTPSYKDYGEDIDNCPKDMMELKKLEKHEVKMSGTFVTVTAASAKWLAAVADVDEQDETHIIPRNDVKLTDFKTLWWIGDYSDVNSGDNAGFVAIKLKNALNTGGFQIQTTDKEKGKFAFEFTGHYSMAAQDEVPYDIYIREGGTEVDPYVLLDKHSLTLEVDDTYTFNTAKYPDNASVTYSSGDTDKATVTSGGKVTAVAAGNTIITASITVEGVTYTDTCTVIVVAPSA